MAGSRRRLTLGLLACVIALSLEPRTDAAPLDERPVTSAEALPGDGVESEVAAIHERIAAHHTGLAAYEITALAKTLHREARAHGLPSSLVLGVIQIESGYYNFAVSHAGALGLMQIMPATGEELAREIGLRWEGPQTLFDPQTNVRLGIAYLAQLQREYRKLSTALAAYNWGPGRINARLRQGVPVPLRYARNVIDAYGDHAERLAARGPASDAVAFTRAATKPSTASMAASSATR